MDNVEHKNDWRADFRIVAKLPDTKTVRTSFYFNIAASCLLVGTIFYTAQTELSLSEKQSEINNVNAEILKNASANSDATKNHAAFKALKATVDELSNFITPQTISQIDFIREITLSLPPQVLVETIEQKQNAAKITAHAKGSAEETTKIAHNLEQELNKNKALSKYYTNIAIGNVQHDGPNGKMNFDITMTVIAAKPQGQK